jgi:16S rRNA (uracil1498-N3)-methyltransferase
MAHFSVHVPGEILEGESLLLDSATAHHLLHVLRVGAGDRITLFDGKGLRADCALRTDGGRRVEAIPGPVERVPPPQLRPRLLQGLAKAAAMDDLLRRATELGVWEIYPLLCRCGDGGLRALKSSSRETRWRTIAISACRQSHNPFLPTIHSPMRPEEVPLLVPSLRIVASLGPDARPWREIVGNFPKIRDVYLAVGPEGDFSAEELQWLRRNDFLPLSLGPRTLTAEMAAWALLSAAQLAWG